MTNQMIIIKNLGCPNCAAKLEKAAQALPGMNRAKIVFGAGSLNVEYDPTRLAQERIIGLIKQFGLDVDTIVPGPTGL